MSIDTIIAEMREHLKDIPYVVGLKTKLNGWADQLSACRTAERVTDECTWSEDIEGNWDCSCGGYFVLNCDTPVENNMKYCCYCGKGLVERRWTDPEVRDEDRKQGDE